MHSMHAVYGVERGNQIKKKKNNSSVIFKF